MSVDDLVKWEILNEDVTLDNLFRLCCYLSTRIRRIRFVTHILVEETTESPYEQLPLDSPFSNSHITQTEDPSIERTFPRQEVYDALRIYLRPHAVSPTQELFERHYPRSILEDEIPTTAIVDVLINRRFWRCGSGGLFLRNVDTHNLPVSIKRGEES